MIVSCGSCQSKFRIDPAKVPAAGTRLRCPKCKGVIAVGPATPPAAAPRPGAAPRAATERAASAPGPRPGAGRPAAAAPAGAPLVVIAHGNGVFCETVAGFLKRSQFVCETATDGEAALALVAARRPAALLVDVALPGIVGYKVCEQVKADPALQATRVVLIGAIYDRSRYRRPPASLYGSDGYIEKHEIPDRLVPLLRSLVAGEAPAPGPRGPAAEPAAAMPVPARAEASSAQAGAASPLPGRESVGAPPRSPARAEAAAASASGSEQARRLARIIVSDIVLYNPDVVKRGIAEGNLPDLLEDELKEGRDLLKARVGAEAAAADYVLEALEDYVRRMSARSPAAAQR